VPVRVAAALATILAFIATVSTPVSADQPFIIAGGQMRVLGIASNNVSDFKDSQSGAFRDSDSFYQSRFRLYTVAESSDMRARAVWVLEVGDVTWGGGGGASGGEFGCRGAVPPVRNSNSIASAVQPILTASSTPGADTRVGPESGGCLGSDGVNVETKNLYIRFEPYSHLRVRLGAAPLRFLPGTRLRMFSADTYNLCACLDDRALPPDVVFTEFTYDDVFQIQLDYQPGDPDVEIQVTVGKISEGALPSNNDVDLYMGRLGYSFTEDIYAAIEALVINQRTLSGATLGDTFWIGASFRMETDAPEALSSKGRLYLGTSAVYGRRAIEAAEMASCGSSKAPKRPCHEAGYGIVASAQIRTLDVILTAAGWYASGDDRRNPRLPSDEPLQANSHRLPVPIAEKSWINPPLIGEWVLSTAWFGAPDVGQSHFQNLSGTYGAGASFQRRLRLAGGILQVGAGLGIIAASGAADVIGNPSRNTEAAGGWGQLVTELDGGFMYRFYNNPNFSFRGLAGLMIPQQNDPAWALGFLTQFDF
jgi:hypothetical protein